MSRNYVDENGNLIQIAGKGIGVAEWGTPIENWLTNATSVESAKLADKDGVLVITGANSGGANFTILEIGTSTKEVLIFDGVHYLGGSIPIKKGCKYYVSKISSATIRTHSFYPFKENNNLQMVREKYSTEETVIGEYLGKPLYRKVVNIASITNSMTYTHNCNIDTLVKYYGKCLYSNKTRPFPFITSSFASTINDYNENTLEFASSQTVTNAEITLEYTKTTD